MVGKFFFSSRSKPNDFSGCAISIEFKPFLRDLETTYDYYYIVTSNGIFLIQTIHFFTNYLITIYYYISYFLNFETESFLD